MSTMLMNVSPSSDSELPLEPQSNEQAMLRRASQRYGTVGALLAGGMVVFDRLLGRKPRQEAPIVVEASGEPGNIDREGITLILNESTTVISPAPYARSQRSRRVRRRRRIQGN
ncbi:MAG: hypothetical protein AAB018_03325 [Actinomycetota bacterium]